MGKSISIKLDGVVIEDIILDYCISNKLIQNDTLPKREVFIETAPGNWVKMNGKIKIKYSK